MLHGKIYTEVLHPLCLFNRADGILDVGISQISKESASKLPNATAPLGADSDQHIVALDVFHQLHCLNMIRKSLYPDYYRGHPLAVNTSHGTLNETAEGNEWHIGNSFRLFSGNMLTKGESALCRLHPPISHVLCRHLDDFLALDSGVAAECSECADYAYV
jgi:hypothetical protein